MESNKESNFISAVLYVHDNANQVSEFLPPLYRILNDNFKKFEIICVNDCSKDDSVKVIRDFADTAENAMISIVNMSLYQGIELSMNAGGDLSIGDFVYEFDSLCMDYDENAIMKVYFHSLKGFDIVSAAPKKIRNMTSKLFYQLYNRHSNSSYKLRSEAFRILSRRAINRVHSISKTIPYRKALYANCGLKMDTLLYQAKSLSSRTYSKSVSEKRRSVAGDSLILFTDVAYKISIILSVLLLAFTLASGIYTCVIFFGRQQPVAGWTTTMLLLSGGFSGVFLMQAIVIKYLSVLVDLVFKRQKYLIESINKISK
ncbi:glycosyltransferase [Desulfitobacterium metallireducens]|uniref:Glycosyltransferase family 2 n=1 Tax=Desulfitobacterium metallireducens DSM 15288 TaxID=871968 RepID=W0EG61_9FIRM|nr:glycosyltransferase [Desulfitobacterium metallireducens]AHF08061.1 glycosyltransferase family 2 [Desulfitobacterium metallireducens DSM 15288]